MFLRGQCTICTLAFTPTTVFALPCGHTFHEHCIKQWVNVPGRGCPNCRRKCCAKDINRIFFDIGGLNDTLNVTTQESGEEALLVKNNELRARLNDLAAGASKAMKDLSVEIDRRVKLETLNEELRARLNDLAAQVLKTKKDISAEVDRRLKLETLIATEKKVAQEAIQKLELKEAELLKVRFMLQDVNETKSENKVSKQELEANDCYEDLFRRRKSVAAIKTPINARGDPGSDEFMESKPRQLSLRWRVREWILRENASSSSSSVLGQPISEALQASTSTQPRPLLNDIKSSNFDEFDKIRVSKGQAYQVLPSATKSETTSFESVMDGRSAQVRPISETLRAKIQFTTGMKSNKVRPWK